jgi:uncharacterized protein GlcG (DUF336 family)
MKLETAQRIVAAALTHVRAQRFKPLAVAVLDARDAIRALAAEDGTSRGRARVAIGKANGAVEMGVGSRGLAERAARMPQFAAAFDSAVGGLIPLPGGVLVKDGAGATLGAVGISGDTADNDEASAVAGIAAVGLVAVVGG